MTDKKFSTNAESTTTISFKELKNGDIFIGGPQQRVYMKTAKAYYTNYDGEQTTMNAVRLGTGCLAHFSDEYNWYTSYCEEEDLSDYTGEVPAGAETFQKLASIRYDKRELTSNRMTYNVSFVEENSVYKIVDLLNNPKDDYRHYLWLHSRNYFGYNYNVSLY